MISLVKLILDTDDLIHLYEEYHRKKNRAEKYKLAVLSESWRCLVEIYSELWRLTTIVDQAGSLGVISLLKMEIKEEYDMNYHHLTPITVDRVNDFLTAHQPIFDWLIGYYPNSVFIP